MPMTVEMRNVRAIQRKTPRDKNRNEDLRERFIRRRRKHVKRMDNNRLRESQKKIEGMLEFHIRRDMTDDQIKAKAYPTELGRTII